MLQTYKYSLKDGIMSRGSSADKDDWGEVNLTH